MTPIGERQRFDLTGRRAFVVGGASGLGKAIAIGLAQHGASVGVGDINATNATEVARGIQGSGGRAVAIECDVRSESSIGSAFESMTEHLGPVDILVYTAFELQMRAKPESYPLDAWERGLKANLTGALLCMQAAGRIMIAQGRGGSIVSISSNTGSSGFGRGLVVYPVSKAGLNQLTRELAVEWAQYNIRVNAVQPCQFRTPAFKKQIDDPSVDSKAMMARMLSGIPLGRFGEPEDIVGPVVFLASDAASMVTGTMLPVDGGNLALNASGFPVW